MSARSLLVTGGAGFIGSNFIRYWLEHHPSDTIVNLDALTYAGNLANLADVADNPNYNFVEGNIADPELVSKVMANCQLVVHFAAETHVDRSILNPSIFLETNVTGTNVLLQAALEHHLDRFHHISTDEVYGSLELGSTDRFNETTAYDPHSPYSASKAASDHLVRAYGQTYGLPFSITNCSNNYGQYQFPEKLVPLTITQVIQGKRVPVYGDGRHVRDWLFVQDHCRAIERVLLDKTTLGKTYLLGGLDQDVSNLELVKMILDKMGQDHQVIEMVADRQGHDRRYAVDWSLSTQELGWEPSVTLSQGLDQTIAWYQHNQQWWQPLKDQSQDFFETNYQSQPSTS
ncbi:MAG: dTDP-glucose 4,6-dehydratase [Candidatus Pacebacteria bacterium CG10_big_fil_rev_8_21_14_0_10_56_10]|nr:MAG: dTDP-glucose 4,6-dehydratase [Candidatus Pacebacteria bacterium CG10_big_fil_rev_8_21_14_0_10_56_10]